MPAASSQKRGLHGKPATAAVRAGFPLLAGQKGDLLGLRRIVRRAGCASLETVSPDQLRMDMSSQPQAMSPWEGHARSPSCPYGTWQRHKDAPGCLIAQGGREKQASCLLRSERCQGDALRAFPCPVPSLRDSGLTGDQPGDLPLWSAVELQAQPRRTGIMLRMNCHRVVSSCDPSWVTAGR